MKTYRRKALRRHRINWEENNSLQFTLEKQRGKVSYWIHTKEGDFLTNRIIIYSQKNPASYSRLVSQTASKSVSHSVNDSVR
jgi:hypothetical protein